MDRLPLAHQTMFADLQQRAADALFDEQFPENGAFVQVERGGKFYWYYKGYRLDPGGQESGRRYMKYVGPVADTDTTERVRRFTDIKTGYRERRRLVSSLRSAGLPTPPPMAGALIEALARAGLFRLRGVLVGTVAFQAYAGLLGVRMPSTALMTGDVDIAQFHSVSALLGDTLPPMEPLLRAVDESFRMIPHHADGRASTAFVNAAGFRVEFLTPNRSADGHQGKPARMPALGGASAEPLRYLDFLIFEPVWSVLLHGGGVSVRVPAPERYAVHKMIVSTRRRAEAASQVKKYKDLEQARLLIEALVLADRGEDLGSAWMEAWDRGPKWKAALESARERLEPASGRLLAAAVRTACRLEGRLADQYGLDDTRL